MQKLMSMGWPGNVRELENLVERMVVLSPHSVIQSSDIPSSDKPGTESFYGEAIQDSPTLEQLEKRYIQTVIEKTGAKKEKTAQILGINRRTLYRKLKEYNLNTQEDDDGELAEPTE
jgi:DNA-binding NtrC family response regulator